MLRGSNLEHLPEGDPSSQVEKPGVQRTTQASSAADGGGATEHVLREGARVTIHSIKAQPDLNGLQGTLLSWVEAEQRWKIRVDNGLGKFLKPDNLHLLDGEETGSACGNSPLALPSLKAGSRVRVCNVRTQQHLNGTLGTLLDWDHAYD
eukprot:4715850-Amphidinium_carterae.1